MVIDDEVFEHLKKAIVAGIISLENTKAYYNMVNNPNTRDFLMRTGCTTAHFEFLADVLSEPRYARCPNCGHYNDNIECPIVVCDYCNHDFTIHLESGIRVCKDCVAFKLKKCDKNSPYINTNKEKTNGRKIPKAW